MAEEEVVVSDKNESVELQKIKDSKRKKVLILLAVFAALTVLAIFMIPILQGIFGVAAIQKARVVVSVIVYGLLICFIGVDVVLVKLYMSLK